MSGVLTIKDSDFQSEKINVNYKKIQKMAFFYEALENGWTIKKIGDAKYEFIKDGASKLELKNFLKYHMKTKEILR